MSENELGRRKGVSFLQAEGLEPLPRIQTGTKITPKFRAFAYGVLSDALGYYHMVPSENTRHIWVSYFAKFEDDLPNYPDPFHTKLKNYIQNDAKLYDILQYCARKRLLSRQQYNAITAAMREQLLGYRFVGGYSGTPTLMPMDDQAEADANQTDYAELASLPASAEHFRQSIEHMKNGHFRGSVTESISAVESVIKSLTGDKSVTLGSGLKLLSKNSGLHPALKTGLEKIYGWTNSPNGMRHAMSDETVPISEAEARYMFSACLAFAAWLKRSNIQ